MEKRRKIKGGKADCNQINHWQSLTINRQSKLRLFRLGLYHLLLYHFHLKTILRVYFDVCSLVVDMNMCQQDQLLLGM